MSVRDALTCRASLFRKQFTGLFSEFTLAERLTYSGICPEPRKGCQPLT